MPTLRGAVLSAMTLDIFNRHPEKVAMTNCTQLINCLSSLYLAHEDRSASLPSAASSKSTLPTKAAGRCVRFSPRRK